MGFVTTKFSLPTVTRNDGTLGAYVQMNPRTSGPRFIWPAERIAIWQAQQKAAAAAAAAKKKSWFGLGNTPAPLISPVPFGPPVPPDMIKNGQYDLETIQALLGTQAAVAAKTQMDAAKKTGQAPPSSGSSPNILLPYEWLPNIMWTGAAVLAGIVVFTVVKSSKKEKTGRPIAGAHVYESL
ncbi:MAG: hypothetical protein LAP21_08390 [Acidobacteriia bacterium]|nr:hypothetical protein [Terriglobia bacterium]